MKRALLPLSVSFALVLAGALTIGAGAGARARPNRAFVVVLSVPRAGDVTYGVARVRIVQSARKAATPGQIVFGERVGGLRLVARSAQWRALHATTRLYAVVSRVAGDPSQRDVAFFIVRRRSGRRRLDLPTGVVTFAISNATAQVGSYWVRGIDARGHANIFHVRNILATALANWRRYVAALTLTHALDAAAHPVEAAHAQPSTPTAAAAAGQPRDPGPWFGGQHPSKRMVAVYRLTFGTLGNRLRFDALKRDSLVVDFIEHELHNHALAARWRRVAGEVPVVVPDKYAAAAEEEAQFEKVRPPKITHAHVAIDDSGNSTDHGQLDINTLLPASRVTLTVEKLGTGTGTVTDPAGGAGAINCGSVCSETFTSYGPMTVELDATPAPGSRFVGWQAGCELYLGNSCLVDLSADTELAAVFASVSPPPTTAYMLTVTSASAGYGGGTVTSSPPGISCTSTCGASFAVGSTVTLTAVPDQNSGFNYWTGCDSVSGLTCTVRMTAAKSVTALFGYP